MVREVFDSVADSYDVMNDVMSAGMHRLWKDDFVRRIGAEHMVAAAAAAATTPTPTPTGAASSGERAVRFLDVAGGTGDIAFRIADAAARGRRKAMTSLTSMASAPPRPEIVVSDINRKMLDVGERRAEQRGIGTDANGPQLSWVEANAQELPFDDDSFDVYTIAFGIRNVTNIPAALSEARRVLRPGGRFLCLEFSAVRNPLFASVYDAYSMSVIPSMGELVASDRTSLRSRFRAPQRLALSLSRSLALSLSRSLAHASTHVHALLSTLARATPPPIARLHHTGDSYQYLVESIRKFPKQEAFETMLADAGFRCTAHDDLMGGIVAIHTGFSV